MRNCRLLTATQRLLRPLQLTNAKTLAITKRSISTIAPKLDRRTNKEKRFVESHSPHDEVVNYRKQQAYRSLLISLRGPAHAKALQRDLMRYGDISTLYSFARSKDQNYALVEFKQNTGVQRVMADASFHSDGRPCIPIQTPFLHLRSGTCIANTPAPALPMHATVMQELQQSTESSSISRQMELLYSDFKLTDLSIRLHYLLLITIESTCKRFIPSSKVLPFGSLSSGLGRFDCDLDMVLLLDTNENMQHIRRRDGLRFAFKDLVPSERWHNQKTLEMISHFIRVYLPRCQNVAPILRARVPIVKFSHTDLGVECDLCVENRDGPKMAKLLHTLIGIDERFAVLLFTIRHWARSRGVTHDSPVQSLSNFMLTVLLISYLQQLPTPVLPMLNAVIDNRGDGVQIRDKIDWKPKKQNSASHEDLLCGFLEYYSQFLYDKTTICTVHSNQSRSKAEEQHSTVLSVRNPLLPEHNICRNVTNGYLKIFVNICKEDADIMNKWKRSNARGSLWDLCINKATVSNTPPSDKQSSPFVPKNPHGADDNNNQVIDESKVNGQFDAELFLNADDNEFIDDNMSHKQNT